MIKRIRFYLAFGVRLIGFILELPSLLFYTISDLIKNKEDEFEF